LCLNINILKDKNLFWCSTPGCEEVLNKIKKKNNNNNQKKEIFVDAENN
jgi:hypothetical protein